MTKYYIRARKLKWNEVKKEKYDEYLKSLQKDFTVVGAKTDKQKEEYIERFAKVEE